jgi:hypothetical protein
MTPKHYPDEPPLKNYDSFFQANSQKNNRKIEMSDDVRQRVMINVYYFKHIKPLSLARNEKVNLGISLIMSIVT